MADQEKRFTFTAQDNASGTFKKLRGEAEQMFGGWTDAARKYAKTEKDLLSELSRSIKDYTKDAERHAQQRAGIIGGKIESERKTSGATWGEARQKFTGELEDLESFKSEVKETVQILEGLFKEFKGKDKEPEEKKGRSGGIGVFGVPSGKGENICINLCEETIEALGNRIGSSVSGEKRKDEKADEEKITNALRKNDFFREILKDVKAAATSIPTAQNENALTPKLYDSIATMSMRLTSELLAGTSQLAGADSLATFTRNMGSAMAEVVGDVVGQSKARELEEREKQQVSTLSLAASTNKSISGLSRYGLSTAETAVIAREIAVSSGTARDIDRRTKESVQFERGYGVDKGIISQQESLLRITGESAGESIARIIATNQNRGRFKGDDFSSLGEIIQQNTQATLEQGRRLEKVNVGGTASSLAILRSLGGSFGGQFGGERYSQINQALINPANEYQQAQSFGTLTSLKPGASMFELMEMQEKGINQKGYLSETLKRMKKQYGGGDAFKIAVKDTFGFGAETSRAISEQFLANPNMFEGMGIESEADARKAVGLKGTGGIRKDVESRAGSYQSTVQASAAVISDAFAKDMVEGFTTALSITFNKAGKEIKRDVQKIADAIEKKYKDQD